jgi:branched-chain amino acid transport system permease protein
MHTFVQLLVEGIEQGGVYALWALSYSLVYQMLGLMNFAFGDTLLLVLYFIVAMVTLAGLPFWAAILLALILAPAMFALVERQVYSRFVGRGQGEMGFIAAIACAYIFRNAATQLLGNEPIAFPTLAANRVFTVAGIKLNSNGLIILVTACVLLVTFVVYFRLTRTGRAIGLMGQDRRMAAVIGVPVRRIVTIVYGVSGVLGIIGAILFANFATGVNSATGFYITFQAFIAATVGGAGSLAGSVLGGLALGVVEAMAAGYVSGNFSEAIGWSVMALIVLVRPRGLLGRVEVERV